MRLKLLIALASFAVLGSSYYFLINYNGNSTKPEPYTVDVSKFGLKPITSAEAPEQYAQREMRTCLKAVEFSVSCYEPIAYLLLDQFDHDKTINLLNSTQNDKEIYSMCHGTMHFVGRIAYSKVRNVPALYSKDRSPCNGGFYHGVMEQYFKELNVDFYKDGDAKIVGVAKKACGDKKKYSNPFYFRDCLHGMGHALMYVTNYDLPRSLDLCEKISSEYRRCFGGVYMENGGSATSKDHISKYLDPKNPNFPCDAESDEIRKAHCYGFQAAYFTKLTKGDWPKTTKLCFGVPKEHQLGCFGRMGGEISNAEPGTSALKQICSKINVPKHVSICLKGGMGVWAGKLINRDPQLLKNFCDSLESRYRGLCFKMTGKVFVKWYGKDSAYGKCSEIIVTQKHMEKCQKSVNYWLAAVYKR